MSSGGYDGSIRINTKIDDSTFNRKLKGMVSNTGSLETSVKSIDTKMNGLIGTVKKLGAALLTAFSVAALINVGKQAIDTASDIMEVQNVVDTAFGDMSYKMEEFAKTSIESFGMSKLTAKQTGSTYMAMARGMGLAAESASDMAIALTGLSGDMASFYNVQQSVADTALKSVFTGETETLKQFGVVMTEANLNAYALTKGMNKTMQQMSQSEKVAIRYQYVMEQLGLAQGDFLKTQDSWANQTRILSERWKELLGILGTGLISVLTPVVKFLNTLVQTLINVSTEVGNLLSQTFGIEIKTSSAGTTGIDMSSYDDATTAIDEATAAQEGLTDATNATNKAAKDAVAPFDKINVLQQDTTDSANTNLADTQNTTKANNQLSDAVSDVSEKIEALKSIIQDFFKPFTDSWNMYGQGVIDSVKNALISIGEMLLAIGASFLSVWSNGTGTEFLGLILQIITNIFDTVSNLSQRFTEAWNNAGTGTQIVQNIADIINILLSYIEKVSAAFVDWSSNIDFSPMLQSFERLTDALKPLAENIGEALYWFFTEVLLPLASWTITDVIPVFLDGLAAAIDLLNSVIDALQPLATWLWDSFLKPLAEWTGGVIIDIIKMLVDALYGISDWISKHQELVQNLVIIIGSFAAAWIIVTGAINGFIAIVTAVVAIVKTIGLVIAALTSPIGLVILAIGAIIAIIVLCIKYWDDIKETAIKVWDSIVSAWNSAGEWFNKNVVEPIANFFSELWDGVTDVASKAWESIVKAFKDAGNWFSNTVTEPIKDLFEKWAPFIGEAAKLAWQMVADAFKDAGDWFNDKVIDPILDAFNSLWSGVKGIINKILDMVEGFINGFIGGINLIISALNTLNFDIPSWVPLIGGNSFGFDLPSVQYAKIPRLAEGAVIQPNQEFLAVLGDQTRGVNIETPLSTMLEAFRGALSEMNYSNNRSPGTVILELDGKQLARAQLPYTNAESSRIGIRLVTGDT